MEIYIHEKYYIKERDVAREREYNLSQKGLIGIKKEHHIVKRINNKNHELVGEFSKSTVIMRD